MPNDHEIRAAYDRDTLVVYQAYAPAIAQPAMEAQRFVPPFSFGRMTWIKPSFLWLMHRSNWGQKANQERILVISSSVITGAAAPLIIFQHIIRLWLLPVSDQQRQDRPLSKKG